MGLGRWWQKRKEKKAKKVLEKAGYKVEAPNGGVSEAPVMADAPGPEEVPPPSPLPPLGVSEMFDGWVKGVAKHHGCSEEHVRGTEEAKNYAKRLGFWKPPA